MQWDLWVDFHRVDENGLTVASTDDLRPGVHLHRRDFVVVGDDDADPAIAVVTELADDGFMRLCVLPGPASQYPDLLARMTVGAG